MTCRRLNSIAAIFLFVLLIALLGVRAQTPAQTQPPLEYQKAAGKTPSAWPKEPVRAPKGMVVTDERLASEVGADILKEGGNAVDAAVAVGFALAVVEPEAGNIGGGGFMLVRLRDGRTNFVDYREQAPQNTTRDLYRGADGKIDSKASVVGYRAIGVPGTVAGLCLALKDYGTMKLPEVMAPAIRLAAEGFPVSERLAGLWRMAQPLLEPFPMSKRIYLKGGAFYQPGEIFRQPELAATLRRIAQLGPAEFYRGQTAKNLADEMAKQGGLITLADLNLYQARIRVPLRTNYEASGSKWEVITSPPPSSGGIALIEALNILEPLELKSWDDPQSVHWVIESLRRVFADRAAYLGDSDFVHVPVKGLTDPRYAAELRATIDPLRASSSKQVGAGNPAPFDSAPGTPTGTGSRLLREQTGWQERELRRGGQTTHFSVVDAAGNAVSNTYTINAYFGSGVTSSGGFLLNDEMDDFAADPGAPNMFGLIQSENNAIGPGRRPLSSMTPTILLRDGKLSFVTGSPGGATIISVVLLSALNWMRLGMNAQAAVNAPRFHQQWMPDEVGIEPSFSDGVVSDLRQRGYTLAEKDWIGKVEAIGIDAKTGERLGAADPRRNGAAVGY